MRALSILTLTALALILAASLAGAQDKDYGEVLDKGLRSDEAYSYSLIIQSEGSPGKTRMLEKARIFSPDLPTVYFKQAVDALPDIFESFNSLLSGFKAYGKNFWWSLSLMGLLYSGAMLSLVISLAVIAGISLAMYVPLMAHDINESKAKILLPLLMVPSVLGGPLFILAGAMFVVGFYFSKSSKSVVYLTMIAVIASPLLIRHLDTYFSAASSAEVRAIVAVNEGRDNDFALQVLAGGEDRETRFSYALALKREGFYDEAIAVYQALARERPGRRLYNNLGNAYMGKEQPNLARNAYENSIRISPSALTFYNLSQIYRGLLDYKKGDEYYNKAVAQDRQVISQLTATTGDSLNRYLADETYSTKELWVYAARGSRQFINLFPVGPLAAMGIGALLLLMFLYLDSAVKIKAFRCSSCGHVYCGDCSPNRQRENMCNDCYGALVKIDESDRKKRVTKMLSAHETKNRNRKYLKALSYAPPGIAHIYDGKPLSGLLFLWPFVFCITIIWLNPFIRTGLMGFTHGWLIAPLALFAAFLYLASNISVSRRL